MNRMFSIGEQPQQTIQPVEEVKMGTIGMDFSKLTQSAVPILSTDS